jgi:predicted transposase YbfD/YdcC
LTVKSNQETLYCQIGFQFEGKRKIPFTATDVEKRHGRQTRWELKAKEAPEHIKTNWPGSAWIVELITCTTTCKGKRDIACHRFITSLRTTPDALLRLVRERWSIENEWHLVRDTQLGEDAHRYTNRTGVAVFSFLRTVVMNLLHRGGYRSIRQGFGELAFDIKGMLALGGVTAHPGEV